MGDELRREVADAISVLVDDLTLGRHGDPHVAFAVLVYPDREPAVVSLSPAGAHDLTTLVRGKTDAEERPRLFTAEELAEAQYALQQAHLGLICSDGHDKSEEPGALIGRFIEQGWSRQRQYPLERALAQAADAAARPAKCPSCKRRFTERGLPAHLRMNDRCRGRIEAAASPSP